MMAVLAVAWAFGGIASYLVLTTKRASFRVNGIVSGWDCAPIAAKESPGRANPLNRNSLLFISVPEFWDGGKTRQNFGTEEEFAGIFPPSQNSAEFFLRPKIVKFPTDGYWPRGAGLDKYSFDWASLLSGVTLSGSMRTIR